MQVLLCRRPTFEMSFGARTTFGLPCLEESKSRSPECSNFILNRFLFDRVSSLYNRNDNQPCNSTFEMSFGSKTIFGLP